MQLKITWILRGDDEENRIDLLLPEEQKIQDTMKILADNGYMYADYNVRYIRSMRTGRLVGVEDTYKTGHIYNGDILEAVAQE